MEEMGSKERVLNTAFPIPCSDTCSFISPFPGRDVLSAVPANIPRWFSFLLHAAHTPREETTTAASPLSAEPKQPHLPGGAGGS